MKEEDLVVVPSGQGFYVARVSGPATHDELQVENDTAFRRQVEWLNNGQSIPRNFAKSAQISRMKSKGTSANAGGLVGDIKDCLTLAGSGDEPSFVTDLQNDLKNVTLEALRCGHMDDRRFEELIETVLRRLGAVDTRIVPRINDEGIDIFATFLIAGIFRQIVGIQVKHYQPEPPVGAEVVCQLTQGIEKSSEKVMLGIVITSGNCGYFKKGGKFTPSLVAEIGSVIEMHMKRIGMITDEPLSEHTKRILEEKRLEFEKRINVSMGDYESSFRMALNCVMFAVLGQWCIWTVA